MMVMLDFETLGTEPNSIVISLGAVMFNRSGILGERLFEFNLDDQIKNGRKFSSSTLTWFMNQSDSARSVFKDHDFKITIGEFFKQFEEFLQENLKKENETLKDLKPWSNGANFDVAIIEDMYRKHHLEGEKAIPWKFWNVVCFRTFKMLTKCDLLVARPKGSHHNALEDAKHQANCVLAHWKKMDLKREAK